MHDPEHHGALVPVASTEARCPMARLCKPKGPEVRLHQTIAAVDADHWDALASGRGLFLQRPFLEALEAGDEAALRYALFYDEGGAARGIACFQIARFEGQPLGALLVSRALSFFTRRLRAFREPLSFWLIVCGHPSLTGEHGFAFDAGVDAAWAARGLMSAARQIQREADAEGRPSAILVKDLLPGSCSIAQRLPEHGFTDVRAEPSMVLSLDEGWGGMEDYLEALTSKFRVKARRAFSKSKALEVRPLTVKDLALQEGRVDELYHAVTARAGYRLGDFEAASLQRLARALGDRFIAQGYFLGEQLVGFLSAFVDHPTLEAHLVGIDYKLNRAHGIYPRMLYDYLNIAFERGLSQVHYGRTAQEIKSTLGAVPVPTHCFVRHTCPAFNQFLPLLARSINPGEFPTRRPFKEAWYRLNEPQIKASLGLFEPELSP